MDLQSVSAFLHQLADKLAQDQDFLRRGEDDFTLEIPNNVVLELKAEEENAKPLLSITHSARNYFRHRQTCLIIARSGE